MSGTSLYRQVIDDLVGQIARGDLAPGAMLPSEPDLGAVFGVSQGTARKALIELESRGIVIRQQGRGTFVKIQTPEAALFHFFRLRRPDGSMPTPELIDQTLTRRKSTARERDALTGAPTHVYQLIRSRKLDGTAAIHEKIVLPTTVFPGLIDRGPLPNTLYALFQSAYSCAIFRADETLVAGPPSQDAQTALSLTTSDPVLAVERRAIDLLDRVVELRHSTYLTRDHIYQIQLS